ncbi:MAG: hypothetical protein KBA15_13755 [Spirochaetes bacterium]|jgi:hypothetical protein|nr:hypothetical protein [Spirochaetota bacterium]
MTPLALTAITNFLWAGQAFFLAGILFGGMDEFAGPYGVWAVALALMGLGALLGGIDHGFFEPMGRETRGRVVMQKLSWIVAGAMTFSIILVCALRFFEGTLRDVIIAIGAVQLCVFLVFIFLTDKFLVVVINYAPVMLLFLGLNIYGLSSGTGSVNLVAGLIIAFIASAVQVAKVNIFHPLNWNGLYHLIMMIATLFLYMGGLDLR